MRGAQEYPADLLLAGLAEIARAGFPLAAFRSPTAGGAWTSGWRFALVADGLSAEGSDLTMERRLPIGAGLAEGSGGDR
jgi:hypothetical protein